MIIKDTDEPELYLFFSVDIIDSTTLKYGTKDKPSLQNWYNSILTFYEEFPTQFQVALDSVTSIFHLPSNIQLSTWKYSGDEILFFINIKNENEVPASIFAFERLLNEWYDPTDVKQIHLKGCAWIGQFPFIDRRLSIKQSDTDQNSKLDFIGPSIDCGFRLGKYASRNQIVLSVEIVDLCRVCTDFSLNLYYLKSENLKGVLAQGSEAESSIPQEISIDENCYYLDETILNNMGIKDSNSERYGYFVVKYDFTNATVEVINTKGYDGKYTLTQLTEE